MRSFPQTLRSISQSFIQLLEWRRSTITSGYYLITQITRCYDHAVTCILDSVTLLSVLPTYFQSTCLSQHTLTQSITSNTSNRVPIKKIAPLPPHIPMVDTFPEKCPPQRSPVVTFPLFCTSDHINYEHILTEYIFHDSPPSHSLKKSNSPSQPPISVLAKARHFGQECKTHT